ncbi:myotrophin [Anableps anableps]
MGDKHVMWAIKTGDLDEVKAKLVTAEDVNQIMSSGRMPLHYAADYGQTEVMEYLISIGANVNAKDKHGFSPLASACFEDHIDCVKILLEKGADKNEKTEDGNGVFEASNNEALKALFK